MKMPTKVKRSKISFRIFAYENHPTCSSRDVLNLIPFIFSICLMPMEYFFIKVWQMSEWTNSITWNHGETQNQLNILHNILWTLLVIHYPWQIRFIKKQRQLKYKKANSNQYPAPFWILCRLDVPLSSWPSFPPQVHTHAIIFNKWGITEETASLVHQEAPQRAKTHVSTAGYKFWLLRFSICK